MTAIDNTFDSCGVLSPLTSLLPGAIERRRRHGSLSGHLTCQPENQAPHHRRNALVGAEQSADLCVQVAFVFHDSGQVRIVEAPSEEAGKGTNQFIHGASPGAREESGRIQANDECPLSDGRFCIGGLYALSKDGGPSEVIITLSAVCYRQWLLSITTHYPRA
ncbi:hypothetical protein [Cupriavidus oxalaticus]|uniref:hypothetical protein n=1 Tax=Cupriavidus oxalaticus TaxID=96344 RepID=UPI001243C827|nr:hypothetical protein [Cupriavidus oxalaticus]